MVEVADTTGKRPSRIQAFVALSCNTGRASLTLRARRNGLLQARVAVPLWLLIASTQRGNFPGDMMALAHIGILIARVPAAESMQHAGFDAHFGLRQS